jgi:peptide-methionine (S)-S-oxide reductase
MTATAETKTETLVLGGGCFWCLDATFQLVPGVKSVVCGYAGGSAVNPSYEQVCTGGTGHAEVVKIEYDPTQTSEEKLLEFFWKIHDPTSLNAQGDDHGTQYRSIILYANDTQKTSAEKSKASAQAKFSDPIVTEIVPLKVFYAAEDYHQDYFRKNPNTGYCRLVVKSKVDKAKQVLAPH